ncbi:MAG: polymerase sigma70 [Candidatus Saccharibacteria bacterium]|nr:polymerase sigma70 [Candidatus Saccharibacteria bacterium]
MAFDYEALMNGTSEPESLIIEQKADPIAVAAFESETTEAVVVPMQLTAEQRSLAEEHHDLVRMVVGRMGMVASFERDHAMGDGFVGLCMAATQYDPTRGEATFNTFAAYRIKGQVIDGYRSFYQSRGPEGSAARAFSTLIGTAVSFEQTMDSDVGDGLTLIDIIGNTTYEPSEIVLADTELELTPQLNYALATLTDRERTVIYGRFYENKTLMQIAGELGVSESRICQMVAKILKKLRMQIIDAA